MRGIHRHLNYSNVMVTILAFIVLTGGTAVALNGANSVQSDDLGPGAQVTAPDVAANAVNGSDVVNNSIAGADVSESTLQGVNASSVSGLNVRKIRFQAPFGTPPTVVLNLRGLRIDAQCQNFGDRLDIKAVTTKQDASVYMLGTNTFDQDDTDTVRDFDGTDFEDGDFDTGDVVEVDNELPPDGHVTFPGIATLHYEAPDGSVVVVDLAVDADSLPEGGGSECTLTGVAIGG